MKKSWNIVHEYLNVLNISKLFTGLIMICLNIGSKFITVKLSPSQEEFMKNYVAREVLIFAVCWMGTRDILTSLLLTGAFFIVTEYLFHEDSSLCIAPSYLNKIKDSLDTNGDGIISQSEIDNAIKVLTKTKQAHSSNEKNKEKENVFKAFSANKY
jgi:hypothetical protein